MSKKVVLVIFGGMSLEYEISLKSARYVLLNIRYYKVIPMLINKEGISVRLNLQKLANLFEVREFLLEHLNFEFISWPFSKKDLAKFDIVFPLIHGGMGENGQIQGYLDILNIPYVGNQLKASSICLSKITCKAILKSLKIPIIKHIWFDFYLWEKLNDYIIKRIEKKIGYPLLIKPDDLGSSIGIFKIESRRELKLRIIEVFKFSKKIIIEKFIEAIDIEIGVLGNRIGYKATIPGEISIKDHFYSYDEKYNKSNAIITIPGENLSGQTLKKIYRYAKRIYTFIDGRGLCRIDFLLDKKNQKIYLNEINTIPGFTEISLYPKLWNTMGVPIKKLLKKLIDIGFEKN